MSQLKPSFIQPYQQSLIGGHDGLTSVDIAKALGARHEDVKRSIVSILEQDQAFSVVTAKVKTSGRPVEMYILNVQDAKIVVATYQNDVGRSYLRFLLECERGMLELLPKVLAENEKLKQQIEAMSQAKKRLPARKTKSDGIQRMLVVESMTRYDSIFGEEGEVFQRHFKRVPVENLTNEEWLDAQYTMLFLQHQGITRRMGEVKDALDFERTRKTNVVLLPGRNEDGQH